MNPRHLLFCSASLLAAAMPAPAAIESNANPSPSERAVHVRHLGRLLSAIDVDRDGIVSAQELRLAPIALTAFDLDEDGFVQRDEIMPSRPAHARQAAFRHVLLAASLPPGDSALLLVLDANHDGILQPIELANATSSLQRLDANHDGTLTSEELKSERRTYLVASRG